jgi:hypothetical protein
MDTLETDRLVIRPFTMDDLEEAYQLLDVGMQWAGPNISIEWRKKRLSLYITLSERGGRWPFVWVPGYCPQGIGADRWPLRVPPVVVHPERASLVLASVDWANRRRMG